MNRIEKDLIERLQKRSMHFVMDKKVSYDDHKITCETLEKANLAQLWTLYDKFHEKAVFTLLPYNPSTPPNNSDYIRMMLGNLFVGIEIDGYAHS